MSATALKLKYRLVAREMAREMGLPCTYWQDTQLLLFYAEKLISGNY
ncbi:hypothetical protein [Paraburkholderia humisilvae]|uniref:Uncharacterized protein n=1 Tax=Paraburkholderia humisilvae TaxID=627669 RepID=A0A6J5EGJ5_9BURK|nr:hypothetical protein [Paraburkholderia humisilvae]CAB3764312.1 hypothetical protein LMG29542_04845 [Paraburkholderia humisilvae]